MISKTVAFLLGIPYLNETLAILNDKYGLLSKSYLKGEDKSYNLKKNNNIYFAGQITGVEGYVESIASGLVAGINAVNRYRMLIKDNEIKSNKIDNGSENNINYNIINEKAKYTKLETEENFKIK